MPAYDFRCPACDVTFEVQRPMGSTAEVVCPTCEQPAKRVFSPVGVAFKGSGFHNTDYKDSKPDKPAAAPKPCEATKSDSSACASCPAASAQ